MTQDQREGIADGRRNVQKTASESRKLRNRLSQQAFRERQAFYVMELEKRLQNAHKTESARMAELEAQNRAMRDQLLDYRKRLRSVQASLEGVTVAMTDTLFDKPAASNPSDSDPDDERRPVTHHPTGWSDDGSAPGHASWASFPEPDVLVCNDSLAENMDPVASSHSFEATAMLNGHATPTSFPSPLCSNLRESVPYQDSNMTGPRNDFQLPGASLPGETLVNPPEAMPFGTKSLFSAHILAFESCLKRKWDELRPLFNHSLPRLRSASELMLSMFVCLAWPTMTAWHAHTRAHIHVSKLIMWRLDPNPTTYLSLATCYRPTRLRLSKVHAAIIDWIPFPSLRDRVFLTYDDSPVLDRVICDIGDAYVVEGDLSKLIENLSTRPGYVGVWDLISVISPLRGTGESQTQHLNHLFAGSYQESPQTTWAPDLNAGIERALPAPSVDALFASPDYALLSFHLLGMHNGCSTFRMDPCFFEKYPELYDGQSDIVAKGTALRPANRSHMSMPVPLTPSLLQRYDDLATWIFNTASETAL